MGRGRVLELTGDGLSGGGIFATTPLPTNVYMNRFILTVACVNKDAHRKYVEENGAPTSKEDYDKHIGFIVSGGKTFYPIQMGFLDMKETVPTYYIILVRPAGDEDGGDKLEVCRVVRPHGVDKNDHAYYQLTEEDLTSLIETDIQLHLFITACAANITYCHSIGSVYGDYIFHELAPNRAFSVGTRLDNIIKMIWQKNKTWLEKHDISAKMFKTTFPTLWVVFEPESQSWQFSIDGKLQAENTDIRTLIRDYANDRIKEGCSTPIIDVLGAFVTACYFSILDHDMQSTSLN